MQRNRKVSGSLELLSNHLPRLWALVTGKYKKVNLWAGLKSMKKTDLHYLFLQIM